MRKYLIEHCEEIMLLLLILALVAILCLACSGCAVENLTVHNFRTMGMDGDSASATAAFVDALAN